MAVPIDLKGDL